MRVAILGPLEVHDDGGAPVAIAGVRLRSLIARLALAGGQPVSTGALAEAVWDGALPAEVANALQTLVSRARRVLGEAAAVEQSAAGYRLAVAPDDVDALRFERLVAEGAVAEALALWRGPALADAGDFAEPFARRLEELRLDATVTFLTRELDAGRAAARVGELEALVAEHSLHEKLTGLLMGALAATGRQADALAAYEALRTRLADELGIDPGPEVRAVHLEVLRGEIAPAAVPAGRTRTNLRAQLTSFVGRTDEVARVGKALQACRLITLVGPGGAGKTRLAAEVAAAVRDNALDDTADGIWLAELASVTDAADVPQAVLGATGLRESRLLPDGTQRITSRDARTRLLEGLADARALLRPLILDIVRRLDGLPLAIELAAARLRTLPLAEISRRLTDRFRLLTGGSRTALPRHRTLRAVVEWSWELLTPAERLLAERFSVFPARATPAAVVAVCAGGQLAGADADELLSSLVDKSLLQPLGDGTRLRMLETIREYGAEKLAAQGEVGELRRRHAAHYSALMREAAPRLLTRDQLSWLAVLRADRDNILAALRYWCDADDAENALSLAVSLAVMALLFGNDSDLADWIGAALAVPGEADADLRTIAEAFHVVARTMDPAPEGTAAGTGADGTGAAYPGLTERVDALDIERYPVAGLLRPAYAMFVKDYGRQRVYFDQARAGRDEWLVAAAWLMAARAGENEGNLDEVRVAVAEAVSRFRALGERWGLSSALQVVAGIRLLDGDLDGANAEYDEASRLLAELGAREDLSQVQLQLAEIAARRGDLARARELVATARVLVESGGTPIDRGIAAAWWASFEVSWGDIDAARPLHVAAERQLTRFGPAHPVREHMEAIVAATGARIAIADEDLPRAREQAARSYRAAVASRDVPLLALASGTAAELALALGQPELAAELLGASAAVRGYPDPTEPTTVNLAARLRAALGADRYARCHATGQALDRAAAIKRLDPAGLG